MDFCSLFFANILKFCGIFFFKHFSIYLHNSDFEMLKSQWQMSLDSRLFGIIYCRARVSSRPEGNSGPQSTQSFLVWSNGPLRKRMPHAERWMRVTLDRRKQRWFGVKLPLDINNCPMLLYIHTFVFIFFRDTKFYFTFLRSSHHFFVI